MTIRIQIEGVTFKDIEEEGIKKFELETTNINTFIEVARCIIESGYMLKAHKFFDGAD